MQSEQEIEATLKTIITPIKMTPESTEKVPRQKRPDSEERKENFSGSSEAAEHFKLRDEAAAVEHFKLRDGAEHGIVELEKRYETVQPAPATKMTTEDKVDDMATAMKQMLVEMQLLMQ